MDLSSWITAGATVVLVIVTVFYVLYTYRIMKQNKLINGELMRPYVVVDLLLHDNKVFLVIKNIGKRPAKQLRIKPSHDISEYVLQTDDKKKKWIDPQSQLKHEFFAPHKELIIFLNWSFRPEVTDVPNGTLMTFEVEYSDSGDEKYIEDCTFDLGLIFNNMQAEIYTDNFYFGEMSKRLKEIREIIKNNPDRDDMSIENQTYIA